MFRWAENILTDMKMERATLLENGEDVARTSCVRVGLVKSSYKEMSANILQASFFLFLISFFPAHEPLEGDFL